MASFAQRFGFGKKGDGGNSIQQEVILETMKEAQESLANQISQDTSSENNIEAIRSHNSKSLAPDIKSQDETLFEQEIEENSLERLLRSIELAASPEELSALMRQYEELVASWGDKVSKLRSEKRLNEYLSIMAASAMLQKMLQNPDILLSGKKIAELLQTSLKAQPQAIELLAKVMQAQNQQLHEQTQQLTKQRSGHEQSLQTTTEVLKQDPKQLMPQGLQNSLKQVQENVTKSQLSRIEQVRQNSGQLIQAQITALVTDKLPVSALPETKAQIPLEQRQAQNQPQKESVKNPGLTQQQASPERAVNVKGNIIDITARLKERTGVESSTYKPIAKDTLSQAHICTGSCNHEHSQVTHRDIQPKTMGNDIVSKAHVCTGPNCCGGKNHVHSHDNLQVIQPKAMGTDMVSKANAHGPGCGCSSCRGEHNHKHQQQTQYKAHTEKQEHSHKHEHGPSCSCCGHGAKATEIGRSQQMARVG